MKVAIHTGEGRWNTARLGEVEMLSLVRAQQKGGLDNEKDTGDNDGFGDAGGADGCLS
jgi:hypothetical protein